MNLCLCVCGKSVEKMKHHIGIERKYCELWESTIEWKTTYCITIIEQNITWVRECGIEKWEYLEYVMYIIFKYKKSKFIYTYYLYKYLYENETRENIIN